MDDLTTRVLAKAKTKQKGGGTKKHGRNLAKCKNYRLTKYRKNKMAKLSKHMKAHISDACAKAAYDLLMTK